MNSLFPFLAFLSTDSISFCCAFGIRKRIWTNDNTNGLMSKLSFFFVLSFIRDFKEKIFKPLFFSSCRLIPRCLVGEADTVGYVVGYAF